MAQPRTTLLIRNADVWGFGRGDVFVTGGRIAQIGRELSNVAADREINAGGGALLPGLHDHHIHLAGLAVRGQSVWCGPPEVTTRDELAARLAAPGMGWIRGVGYHESVLGGLPDARELDRLESDRPLRIQHRSGRMWLLNSAALDELLAHGDAPSGMEREGGHFTGRLFDEDAWLREALGSSPPDFASVSMELAAHGVTGITDMTPQNGKEIATHFAAQRRDLRLAQRCMLAGTLALAQAEQDGWTLGPVKLHLHEAQLPDFDETTALARAAHEQGRVLAIYCVSEVELVFALAVLDEAGAVPGDRIEHASVTSPDMAARMAEMRLSVCVQPHFVAERGDRYLIDVEPRQHADLYRLASLADAGIPLAGGSDAPFGSADPWAAMRAAVARETAQGSIIGGTEAISPEAALDLYLADPADLSYRRRIVPGAEADFCLLKPRWHEARTRLHCSDVNATIVSGRVIYDRVDQPPLQCEPS